MWPSSIANTLLCPKCIYMLLCMIKLCIKMQKSLNSVMLRVHVLSIIIMSSTKVAAGTVTMHNLYTL